MLESVSEVETGSSILQSRMVRNIQSVAHPPSRREAQTTKRRWHEKGGKGYICTKNDEEVCFRPGMVPNRVLLRGNPPITPNAIYSAHRMLILHITSIRGGRPHIPEAYTDSVSRTSHGDSSH